jgi:EmrB/QacA subfamily drug resistance transporter
VPPAASGGLEPELRRLAGVVVLGAIMVILDTTIVSVAIDTLGRELHATLSTISWVSTAYLLALAIVIPLTGWSVERFGATRMWLGSLTLFLAGSALCGAAWSAGSLIAFRALQGLGGGMIIPLMMTVLVRAAGPERAGRMMSVVGVPALVAPVLGPVIGGLVVDSLSWRWIFYVNLPIGGLALLAAWRVLPRDDRGTPQRLDVPGLLLISPGLAALVYGLSEAGNGGGFGSAKAQVGIAAGLVLTAAFVVNALRTRTRVPLLDLRLFRNGTFSGASLTTFLVGAAMFSSLFVLPLYYQTVRGQSALAAGLLLAPQGLGAMLMMPIAGKITDRRGAGYVVPAGMLVMLLATLVFTQVDADTNEVALALCLFVRGLGLGATIMPAMGAAYQTLTPAAVPRATTMLNIFMRVGGSLGTALVAVVLQWGIAHRVPGATAGGSGSVAPAGKPPEPVADALGAAFGETFWFVVGMTAIGLVAALFLPRHPAAGAATPAAVPETEAEAAGPEIEAVRRDDALTPVGAGR